MTATAMLYCPKKPWTSVWLRIRSWLRVNQGEPFEVTVKEAVKGGVLANVDGITVFIPGSQAARTRICKGSFPVCRQDLYC